MDGLLISIFPIFVLVFSVVVHEVSHGAVANSLGDPTAKNMGRLTLNPLKHLDPFGSILLPFLLYFSTGFMIGYAKPVPYDPTQLRDRKFGPAKVAIAGPLSNIALAVLFGITLRFMPDIFSSPVVPQLFAYIIALNLMLAVFNLFPIPPLDGHWLLMTFLPERFNGAKIFLYRYSLVLLVLFIFFIFPRLVPFVSFLFRLLTGVPL
jgi:Zn-dependent protease